MAVTGIMPAALTDTGRARKGGAAAAHIPGLAVRQIIILAQRD